MKKNNISLIIKNLNFLLSKVNEHFNKNDLMSHEIKLGINPEKKLFNFYLDSKKEKKLKQEYNFFTYEELNIKLLIPKINDVILSIGNFFEKKINEENYIIKIFNFENEKNIEICFIFHNFLTISTFDFLVFNQRFFNYELSNNQIILNKFSTDFNFFLFDNNSKIKFTKFKKFNLSLFVIINMNYEKIENEIENKIINSISALKNEFEQKVIALINKHELEVSIQTIISSFETLYHITNNQELFSNLEKIFNPNLSDDGLQIDNRLYKNFLSFKK